jgi:GTP-binding protein HflX
MNDQDSGRKNGRLFELTPLQKRALLIGCFEGAKDKPQVLLTLDELERLGETFGLETVQKLPVPLRKIDPGTFIGKGKVEELAQLCITQNIDLVIFDEEITPQQQRNLEKEIGKAVIDRSELILGIFSQRAQTKEAKIQIELAQARYQLPRLRGLWTHLHRQRSGGGKGSGGYVKGEGEKQIEIDRRLLDRRIEQLEKDLEEVKKNRETQRKARERSLLPTFAIIGYTNAGKSTLLKALTEADVLVEDKLFATLDTTTRKFKLSNRQEILLTDTVGFIRKLPHLLIAAFKSTLEEAVSSDILLHLIDGSSPEAINQGLATLDVLRELNSELKPIITVINKIDACQDRSFIEKLKISFPKTVQISSITREGFSDLEEAIIREISNLRLRVKLVIDQKDYAIVADIQKVGKVFSLEYEDNLIHLDAEIPKFYKERVRKFLPESELD